MTTSHRSPRLILVVLLVVFGLLCRSPAQSPPDKSSHSAPAGWNIRFDGSGSRPALADGILYIGSADGAVYALDANTGHQMWRFQTGEALPVQIGPVIVAVPSGTSVIGALTSGAGAPDDKPPLEGVRRINMQPLVENGTVFVGSGDQSLYALDAATGKKKWSYLAGPGMAQINSDFPVPAPILLNGTVYFATTEGLHAVDAQTGEKKWFFETLAESHGPKRPPSGPILGDDVLFLTAWPFGVGSKSLLYAVDVKSGKAKWTTTVEGGLFMSAPLTAPGMVFFSVVEKGSDTRYENGKRIDGKSTLYAVDAASGQTKWKFDAPMEYSRSQPLLAAGNSVFFGTDKGLFALELSTGHLLWTFGKDEPIAMQADDQNIFVDVQRWGFGGMKDTLYALSLSTGAQKWARGVSGEAGVAQLVLKDGVIYASRGHLQALDPVTGKELWTFKGSGRETAGLFSGGRIFLFSPTMTFIGSSQVDRGFLFAIDAKAGKLKP